MTNVASPIELVETPKPLTYDARDLMPDGNPANIVLDAQIYYLRITRAGKLILTK